MSETKNETIIIDADAEVTTPRLSKFKTKLKNINPIHAAVATITVVAGIAGGAYIYNEIKNSEFMDNATELKHIAEGTI